MKNLTPAFYFAISIILFASCAPLRALRWWQPDLQDQYRFEKKEISKSTLPFMFINNAGSTKYKRIKSILDSILQNTNTNAFVVIRNDTVLYENYAAGFNQESLHPSFSVAKSYVGTLVGIAVDKGWIQSTNDLVIKYLPSLIKNDERFNRLTIQHVLDMRTSFDFNEDSTSPFSAIARIYYGTSLNREIKQLKMKAEPGEKFEYQSINTQLLAAILEKCSGKKMEELLSTYLWQPLGSQNNAFWNIDANQTVKAFCCLNASALDFAKLGRLYLNKGMWQGQQLVSKNWIEETVNADTLFKKGYKNQWWACNKIEYFKDSVEAANRLSKLNLKLPIRKLANGKAYIGFKVNDYRAEGILGQIVYVNPDNNVIIVRTGGVPNKNIYFNGFIPKLGREL